MNGSMYVLQSEYAILRYNTPYVRSIAVRRSLGHHQVLVCLSGRISRHVLSVRSPCSMHVTVQVRDGTIIHCTLIRRGRNPRFPLRILFAAIHKVNMGKFAAYEYIINIQLYKK